MNSNDRPKPRKSTLPTTRREGEKRSGKMASETLDGQVAVESYAEQPNLESTWDESEQPQRSNHLIILILGGVLLLAILGGVSILFFKDQGSSQPAANVPATGGSQLPKHAVSDFMESSDPDAVSRSAKKAVEGFMTAKTLKERCQFIHGGEAHLAKMQNFYAISDALEAPSGFSKITLEQLESVEGVPFIHIYALDDSGEKHIFNLFPTSDQMLIDWESSVCYGEMSWEEFQEKKPQEPILMRVFLSRHVEAKPGVPLDRILLSQRDDPNLRIVYVNPDGEIAAELNRSFVPERGILHPYTLSLQWNPERRIAEVVTLKHLYWMDAESYRDAPSPGNSR